MTRHVESGHNTDLVRANHEEHGVREPADNGTTCQIVDADKTQGPLLDELQASRHFLQELTTQRCAPLFVPSVRLGNVGFRLRADYEPD